jgi:hypothetical protein
VYQFDIRFSASFSGTVSDMLFHANPDWNVFRLPAVGKFSAHILQVGVPHVIDRKDEKMVIFFNAFPNVGE